MGSTRLIRGEVTNYSHPRWAPLMGFAGPYVVEFFMWMNSVELSDGTVLEAYKHRETRRYLHLARGGRAFQYHGERGYREIDVTEAMNGAFAGSLDCRRTHC